MEYQKLSLQGFNLRSTFCGYLNAGLFTDCNIIGSCGKGLNVHRVILSSCSEYLARLFLLRNSDTFITIVFPTLKFEDLKRVIEFIYIGEVTLEVNDLDSFMTACGLLKINTIVPKTPDVIETQPLCQGKSAQYNDFPSKTVQLGSNKIHQSYNELSDSSEDSSESGEFESPVIAKKRFKKSTALRNEQGHKNPLKRTTKISPGLKMSVPCIFCQKLYVGQKSVKEHQRICPKNPERRVFHCSECSKEFSRLYRMKIHMEKDHKPASEIMIANGSQLIDQTFS